jgi:hypothetical protein
MAMAFLLEVEQMVKHFQEKWNPVFRPKMRPHRNAGAVSDPRGNENRSSKVLRIRQ